MKCDIKVNINLTLVTGISRSQTNLYFFYNYHLYVISLSQSLNEISDMKSRELKFSISSIRIHFLLISESKSIINLKNLEFAS